MPKPILPIDPKNLPQLPAKGDISSLANKDTLNTLNNIKSPTTFGDQSKVAGQVIKATGDSTLIKLQKEKAFLIQKGIQLDTEYQANILKIEANKQKELQNLQQK